ncbi:MAG: response regulator transcription factor [Syntrophobacterales bacterium]|nr:response regulator transcription factor [Syntrophobacterales bacterium]
MTAENKKKRIVIAEDHTILREGLKSLLSASQELAIVGEAADGREAIQRCRELKPDLLLLDLSMPRLGGIEAIGEVKKQAPSTRILVLTVHKTEEYVLASLRAGAAGYVLKDATHQELLTAIRTVLAGKRYLSPDIADKVIDGYLLGRRNDAPASSWERLTPREREVLKLVAEGSKNREIADFLCISLKTVEKHRDSLMKKLDLHSAAALTAYAIEKGLVSD